MGLHELIYDGYKFLVNYKDREIRVYEGDCCADHLGTLKNLPEGLTWDNIGEMVGEIYHDKPAFLRRIMTDINRDSLAQKLYEFYNKTKV